MDATLGKLRLPYETTIEIRDGQLSHPDLLVHFPIPMQQAWDNVTYTCSNMLLFESRDDIIDWCRRHQMPVGDIQPLQRIGARGRITTDGDAATDHDDLGSVDLDAVPTQQFDDADTRAVRVIAVDQLQPALAQRQAVGGQRGRQLLQRLLQWKLLSMNR